MSTTVIDVQLLRKMFLYGAQTLDANKAWINELNVFPVPDGDTGTNMSMTVVSAVREVVSLDDPDDMTKLCKAISSGSLRGARGNSGVILSQLLRGFCKVVRSTGYIDVPTAAAAFEKAVETAYKAVMKPKEGTILTVARGLSDKCRELADAGVTDFDELLPQVLETGDRVLEKTPEMLPVLKQAGVVDSGGQGLMQLLKGAFEGYKGAEADVDALLNPKKPETPVKEQEGGEPSDAAQEQERSRLANLKYGYAVTFYEVFTKPYNDVIDRDVTAYMQTIADEITTTRTDESMRVFLKTNDPGLILQRALLYGQLTEIAIANLRCGEEVPALNEEGARKVESAAEEPLQAAASDFSPVFEEMPQQEHKELGMIAVAAGEGLAEIFRGLGVDYVISGGQTMNPSTEDILKAVDQVNADTIFLMPNNKNIIMAANQAAAISGEKRLIVIPTKTVPQGITAAINFIPDQGAEMNEQTMKEEISRVRSAEVTYAVRDTVIDDIEIHEGNMMCIGDGGLLCVGSDRDRTTLTGITKIAQEGTELISIYYGEGVTDEEAQALCSSVMEKFPNVDVELQCGGQPVYYYIVSAE